MARVTERREPATETDAVQAAVGAPGTADALTPPAPPPRADGDVSAAERAALGLWVDLVRVAETVRARLSTTLGVACRLAPEEVELLVRLSEAPERRLRMGDVSHSLMLSRSGATRMIDRLAERGLVERVSCPSDRRVVYAGLTSDGQRMLEEAAPLLRTGLIEHLGQHLGAREVDAVTVALRKVLEAEGVGLSSSGPTMKTRLDPASGLAAGSATGWAPDSAAVPPLEGGQDATSAPEPDRSRVQPARLLGRPGQPVGLPGPQERPPGVQPRLYLTVLPPAYGAVAP